MASRGFSQPDSRLGGKPEVTPHSAPAQRGAEPAALVPILTARMMVAITKTQKLMSHSSVLPQRTGQAFSLLHLPSHPKAPLQ